MFLFLFLLVIRHYRMWQRQSSLRPSSGAFLSGFGSAKKSGCAIDEHYWPSSGSVLSGFGFKAMGGDGVGFTLVLSLNVRQSFWSGLGHNECRLGQSKAGPVDSGWQVSLTQVSCLVLGFVLAGREVRCHCNIVVVQVWSRGFWSLKSVIIEFQCEV
ncbi:hypothetical protein RchiOBHm_Chr5g0063741 [Rosa chinensis]|uniref:Uncharacterized protein n=1 Tax=Rosa chinensis TaxID=74649 RepID=A0A2P6QII0_ROSCH|nr:hypothetical protein RchiOBHm_Chr5g0063741 [Rosa chinensis]